nr:hypothetical protein Iba_chr09eCG14560 [Ipomoea batatas]
MNLRVFLRCFEVPRQHELESVSMVFRELISSSSSSSHTGEVVEASSFRYNEDVGKSGSFEHTTSAQYLGLGAKPLTHLVEDVGITFGIKQDMLDFNVDDIHGDDDHCVICDDNQLGLFL